MPTYKLTIEYEGTRYSGWQAQSNTPKTVQGRLLAAAKQILGEVDVGGSGRTDAGVHAAGQVAHLRCREAVNPSDLRRKLNDLLPHDVHVLQCDRAADGFHSRHDAESRIYLYQIARRRTAFAKPFVWWIKDTLNLDAMKSAAPTFVGKHDFSAFADKRAGSESTLVVVDAVDVGEDGDLILVRITASHYLWKMVRKIVAALVEVGRGAMDAGQLRSLLGGEGRFSPTAPPSGLFLEAVLYRGEAFDRPLVAVVPVTTSLPEARRWAGRKKS